MADVVRAYARKGCHDYTQSRQAGQVAHHLPCDTTQTQHVTHTRPVLHTPIDTSCKEEACSAVPAHVLICMARHNAVSTWAESGLYLAQCSPTWVLHGQEVCWGGMLQRIKGLHPLMLQQSASPI